MALNFLNIASSTPSSTQVPANTAHTFSFTASAGSRRCILVNFYFGKSTTAVPTVSSVTYDGSASKVTLVGEVNGNGSDTVYTLTYRIMEADIAAGSATFSITISNFATESHSFDVSQSSDVDQTSPIGSDGVQSQSGTQTGASLTVQCDESTGQVILCANKRREHTYSIVSGETILNQDTSGNVAVPPDHSYATAKEAANGGALTIALSTPGSNRSGNLAFEVIEDTGGPAPTGNPWYHYRQQGFN